MNGIPHFPRLLSSAVALILDSPLVVQPMVYAVKPNYTIDWDSITPVKLQAMINDGIDIKAEGSIGKIPLHNAADCGYAECISVLVKAGSDVNARDNAGMTPLHYAAWNGYASCVDTLLKLNVNANVKNKEELTPLDYAKTQKHSRIIKLLKTAGAK